MKRIFAILIVVLLLLGIIFVGTLGSPFGFKMGLKLAQKFLPGQLSYARVTGLSGGPIHVTDLRYENDQLKITIKSLNLKWSPSHLFIGELWIKKINIDHVNLFLKGSNKSNSKSSFPSLHIPFDVKIRSGELKNLHIEKFNTTAWHIPYLYIHHLSIGHELKGRIATNITQPYPIKLEFIIAGTTEHYRYHLIGKNREINWKLYGTGTDQWIDIHTHHSNTLGGSLHVDAKVYYAPTLRWNGEVNINHLALSHFSKNLPARFDLHLKTDGYYQKKIPYFNIDLGIQAPNNTLSLVGSHHQTWNLAWSVNIKNLTTLLSNGTGTLTGNGTISGPSGQVKNQGTLRGNHLSFQNYRLNTVNANWHTDLKTSQVLNAHLSGSAFQTPFGVFSKFTMDLQGNTNNHQIKLNLAAEENKIGETHLFSTGKGTLAKSLWKGNLSQFTIDSTHFGKWTLAKTPLLSISQESFKIKDFCLHEKANDLCLSMAIDPTKSEQSSLSGKLNINIRHLGFIHQFIPKVADPKGRITAEINLSGSTKNPVAKGQFAIQEGSVDLPDLKISLNRIIFNIDFSHDIINYEASAYSENQPITMTGHTKLQKPDYATELFVRGNNVLIMNTNEYTIYASPNLDVQINGHKVMLKGSLLIPQATLQPTEFKVAVSLPEDTVFVGPDAAATSPWQLYMNVTVTAGDNVQVDSHGVKGRLTGQVNVTRTPTQSTIANGQIHVVDGSFSAHNRDLTIDKNSYITYTNNTLTNPNLNIRASRQIKIQNWRGLSISGLSTITVGVDIRGTLRHPNVSLFSIPTTLSQADILSYLIFGHASNANTPDNVSFLIQAVDDLNIGGGKDKPGGITDQIMQGLGLSEFGVEQETSIDTAGTPLARQDTAFVVGRYISPRIYIRYSRGLVIPLNIVQIRYLIGDNWAIQTESSSLGNGVDILYTVQRP